MKLHQYLALLRKGYLHIAELETAESAPDSLVNRIAPRFGNRGDFRHIVSVVALWLRFKKLQKCGLLSRKWGKIL